MNKLLEIMAALRDPDTGCPWDLQQDFASIVPYTLEEAYEVIDCIERGDWSGLKHELGDLLFQVVFYAQLAKEQQWFDFDDVVTAVCDKMIRRHPHVFTDEVIKDEQQIKSNWEREKALERVEKRQASSNMPAEQWMSVLDDIPMVLPALSRAHKIQKRCRNVGFDWPDVNGAIAKIFEELEEFQQALNKPNCNEENVAEELGDVIFAVVNVSRHLNLDAETLLRDANHKFIGRFQQMEGMAREKGLLLENCSAEQLESWWNAAKQLGPDPHG